MIKPTRLALLASTMLCGFTSPSQAAPQWGVVAGENMVSIPLEVQSPQPAPVAAPAASEDNMVVVDTAGPAEPATYVPITGPNYIEAGLNLHSVTHNQGNWWGQFINGQYQTDPDNRWNAGLLHQKAFQENGYFLSGGNTHLFDDTWFSDVGIGVGTNASFLPAFRGDAAINRRWLEGKNLITTAGLNFSKAQDTYTNYGALLAFSYYFPAPWILQGGVNLGISNPGQVVSNAEFLALTYGYQKNFYITGKVGIAHEAYQLLGGGNITNAFNSHNASLNWRQWLGEDWGYNLGAEYYKNPYYKRNGGVVSVFKEF